MGAVTNIVKQYVPASYRAMVGVSNPYYGATELQALADYVKYRLFATSIVESDEATVLNPVKLRLAGILTTLNFIPAAIDYWGDQLISETTTGTNENVTWPDRREGLWQLFDKLAKEAEILAPVAGVTLNQLAYPRVSQGDNGRGLLITEDPHTFEPAYAKASVRDLIPWQTEPY